MTHKALLRTADRDFLLNQNLTTIGNGSCDVVIDSDGTAALHAIIEFSLENNIYLLRDLSTEQGTFVNDRRIQAGSPARLSHGDRLRFGSGGGVSEGPPPKEYQLVIEFGASVSASAVSSTSPALHRSRPAPAHHLPTVRLGRPTSAGPQIPGGPRSRADSAAAAAAATTAASEQRLAAVQFDLHCLQVEASQRDRQFEELRRQMAAGERESRDRLGVLETEVAAKEAQLADLRERLGRGPVQTELRELERLRKDAAIAGGLLAQMQKDMTGKDATISRLAREVETLKETVKSRDQRITSLLTKTPVDAKVEAEARQARERELQTLRSRLHDAEARATAREATARDLRTALDAAHAEAEKREASTRKLGAELETSRAQAVDRERAERLVRVDLQQASSRLERLRSRLMSIAFSTPGAKGPEGLAQDEELLDMVARAVDERTELRAEIERMRAALAEAGKARALGADATSTVCARLTDAFGRLAERGRAAARLADEVALMAAGVAEAEAAEAAPEAAAAAAEAALLRPLVLAVLGDLREQLRWQRDTEAALEACGAPVRLTEATPAEHLAKLRQRWADTDGQLTRTRARLSELESRLSADMAGQADWLRLEAEARLSDALAAAAAEARKDRAEAIEAAVAAEAERRREAAEREATAFRAAIADLEAALTRRGDEAAEGGRALAAELSELRAREADLLRRLAELEDSGAAAADRTRADTARREAEARESLEQSRRLAEENRRLHDELENSGQLGGRLRDDLERFRSEADGLRKQVHELQMAQQQLQQYLQQQQQQHVQQQQQLQQQLQLQQQQQQQQPRRPSVASASVKAVGPPPTPPQPHQPQQQHPLVALPPQPAFNTEKAEAAAAEAAILKRENSGLRGEVTRLATRLAEAEAAVAAITSAATRAPPASTPAQPPPQQPQRGSASELEACRRRQRAAEAELAAAQARIDKLSDMAESQRGRLAEKTEQLEKARGSVKKLKAALEARDAQAKQTERRLRAEAEAAAEAAAKAAAKAAAASAAADCSDNAASQKFGAVLESELAAFGHQCRGERHVDIIKHQREALSELRRRLKDSELGRPTTTSHDKTAQQVALLQRELAEMRSRQALSETARLGSAPPGILEAELGSTGLARIATVNADLQTERTARAQAADCLEASERTYLTLARAVASAMRLEALPGQAPMSQAAGPPERRRLSEERDRAAGLLADRARQLMERAERKDKLLEGYEGDLARLRQALQLAEARTAQIDDLAERLRSRTEEAQLLRESLVRSRTAGIIVKRRPAGREVAAVATAEAASDNSGDEGNGEGDKEATRKRAIRERMRRKDYEISSLKAELKSREKDLRNANTKLTNMRTTLGLPHESELLASLDNEKA